MTIRSFINPNCNLADALLNLFLTGYFAEVDS